MLGRVVLGEIGVNVGIAEMDGDIVARRRDAVVVSRLAGRVDLDRERARPFEILRGREAGGEQRKRSRKTGLRIADAEVSGAQRAVAKRKWPSVPDAAALFFGWCVASARPLCC